MIKPRFTFEVDASKLLRMLSISNGDYGPIGKQVIRVLLAGNDRLDKDYRANLADCGITIIDHDDKA